MFNCCKKKSCQAIIKTEPAVMDYNVSELLSSSPSLDFSLGESLESVYPLLDLVFSHLSYRDLLSVSEVNKTWREVALKQIKGRQQVAWFSCPGDLRIYKLKRSHNLLHCNPRFCIVLIPTWRCSLRTKICIKYSDGHTCTTEYLQKHILGHPFRETVVLGSMNITSHQDVTQTAERVRSTISLFEGLIIPEIPKTRVAFIRPHSADDSSVRDQNVTSEETINSLLIFCASNQKRHLKYFLEQLLDGQDPREVAIAGGVVTGIKKHFLGSQLCTENQKNYYDINCVAFLQPKNEVPRLLSYSLVLPASLPEASFLEELTKFREKVTMRSQSAAFRFCCSAKGSSRQGETFAFNAVFPRTPVIGLDVFGELGWDTVLFHDECDEEESKRKRTRSSKIPTVFHEWTTTFLLITWDN